MRFIYDMKVQSITQTYNTTPNFRSCWSGFKNLFTTRAAGSFMREPADSFTAQNVLTAEDISYLRKNVFGYLTKQALKKAGDLKKLGFSIKDIAGIFASLMSISYLSTKYDSRDMTDEMLESLTQDFPDMENKHYLAEYIKLRSKASVTEKGFWGNTRMDLDRESFDFFNRLAQKLEKKEYYPLHEIKDTVRYCKEIKASELRRYTAEVLMDKIPNNRVHDAMRNIVSKYQEEELPNLIKCINELNYFKGCNYNILANFPKLDNKILDTFKHICEEGWKRRNQLGGGFIRSKKAIENLFVIEPAETFKTLEILGEKNFIYSFNEGEDNVSDYIFYIANIPYDSPFFF